MSSSDNPLTNRPKCETCGAPAPSKLATLGDEVECYSCSIGDTPTEDQDGGSDE